MKDFSNCAWEYNTHRDCVTHGLVLRPDDTVLVHHEVTVDEYPNGRCHWQVWECRINEPVILIDEGDTQNFAQSRIAAFEVCKRIGLFD